jgi:hypothetical protein
MDEQHTFLNTLNFSKSYLKCQKHSMFRTLKNHNPDKVQLVYNKNIYPETRQIAISGKMRSVVF